MDGLEAIEVPFKKLLDIIDYRIEAEYFNKKYIATENLLKKHICKRFNEIAVANNGRAYSSEAFSAEGDLFVTKIGDVTNKRDIDSWEMLSEDEFKLQKGFLLRDGEILMTLTGDPPDVGKVNMVFPHNRKCTWNQRVARIKRITQDYLSDYSLYAVLSSEICRIQMERFAKGVRQRNLGNDCFSFVNVPVLCERLQRQLDVVVQKHVELLNVSQRIYTEAGVLLKEHIGISGSALPRNAQSIMLFKQSFVKTGRLDAEYYQPKYDAITAMLNAKETVGSLCRIHDNTFVPKQDVEYSYIELSDIGAGGNISGAASMLGIDLPSRARRQVKKGQVLVSSIEGSLESCALVPEEYDNALCSTGFYVVDSGKMNSETLLVLFQSEPIQALLKQRCSGTILTAISKDEFQRMPLPLIDESTQREIAEKVQESVFLRGQAKHLIDVSVRAVEIAIEQDEDTAIEYIRQNT